MDLKDVKAKSFIEFLYLAAKNSKRGFYRQRLLERDPVVAKTLTIRKIWGV